MEERSTEGLVKQLTWGHRNAEYDFDGQFWHMIWIICKFCPSLTYFRHAIYSSSVWENPVSYDLPWFSWVLSWLLWRGEAADAVSPCKAGQQHLIGHVKLEQANSHGFPCKTSHTLSTPILWLFTPFCQSAAADPPWLLKYDESFSLPFQKM